MEKIVEIEVTYKVKIKVKGNSIDGILDKAETIQLEDHLKQDNFEMTSMDLSVKD
jgi:hypothetical protein